MSISRLAYDGNLIDVVRLKKYFPIRGGLFRRAVGQVRAVDDVTFSIRSGETLGLVGESGCGKTTVGRAIMMLITPTEGYTFFETPKEVVDDFTRLLGLIDECKQGAMTSSQAAGIAESISRLLGGAACDIKEDRKKHLCGDAEKIVSKLSDAPPDGVAGRAEQAVLDLIEDAEHEVCRRYCLNYKPKRTLRRMRRRIQFVFQDPFSSLNPKMLVKDIVAEPIRAQLSLMAKDEELRKIFGDRGAKAKRTEKGGPANPGKGKSNVSRGILIRERTIDLLNKVGLNPEHMYRYPHEFSGGQRQRIGIARALSVNPDFVVLDEPTSALDVSVQAQILNMLNDLQNDFGLTYLFISHDLSTIRYMCDRVAVMYLGKIVEYAEKEPLFEKPTHPYTEALLSVIPAPDPDLRRDRIILPGDVPSPANPPPGCRFHTRCPLAEGICSIEDPPLADRGNGHFVACHVR
jgi:oligopeptide/dipeptide ABC transporter ATP-binding protein